MHLQPSPYTRDTDVLWERFWSPMRECGHGCYCRRVRGCGRADYGNEKECGEGLRRAIVHDVVTREDVWVVSKLWNTFHRREHVVEAVKRSLHDWGVSYFDIYYVHFRESPPAFCASARFMWTLS